MGQNVEIYSSECFVEKGSERTHRGSDVKEFEMF
jgi:hypothetical protein